MPKLQDEYLAWAEFRYQVRRWTRISEDAAAAAGLPPQHHQLLLAVKGFPGGAPRIADLAERLQLRHHSVVGLLDRMQERGLIERNPTGEGRVVEITLTREGERLLAAITRALRPQLRRAGQQLIETLEPLVEIDAPKASSRAKVGVKVARSAAR